MIEYPKIETLYDRDDKFKVQPDKLRLPEFDLIKRWWITEKVDGTNIRIMWDFAEQKLTLGGRTDNAQMPTTLANYLRKTFKPEQFQRFTTNVIIFGEGYGEKIQSGGSYRKGVSLRIFDVLIDGWWLEPDNILEIADAFKVMTVPYLKPIKYLPKTLADLLEICGTESLVSIVDGGHGCKPEGIVARTAPGLMLRNGNRLMWKLKLKDF